MATKYVKWEDALADMQRLHEDIAQHSTVLKKRIVKRAEKVKPPRHLTKKKSAPKRRDYVLLPFGKYPHIDIVRGSNAGRKGIVTGLGPKGFRCIIDPIETWQSNVTRWLSREEIVWRSGAPLPDLSDYEASLK